MADLKVLRPELAAALGPERFLREIELSARLTHPHVLPLYDSGEAEGSLLRVMPYVEGESLRDRLAREKQLAIDDALPGEVLEVFGTGMAAGVNRSEGCSDRLCHSRRGGMSTLMARPSPCARVLVLAAFRILHRWRIRIGASPP